MIGIFAVGLENFGRILDDRTIDRDGDVLAGNLFWCSKHAAVTANFSRLVPS